MASNLKVDIVKPTATNGSLSLKGDSGGSATSNGISVDSSGNTSITGTTTIATADINGGDIDGTTIGASSAAAGTFSSVTATTADINGGAIDGTTIGGTTPAAGSFTDMEFNSGYGSVATAYGCRAWVNFDGTSGSGTGSSDITIRASGNVSSITDNGGGVYTVNFATDMPDTNYAISGAARSNGSGSDERFVSLREGGAVYSKSAFKIQTKDSSGNLYDSDIVTVAIFR